MEICCSFGEGAGLGLGGDAAFELGVLDFAENLADLGALGNAEREEVGSSEKALGVEGFGGELFQRGLAEFVGVHFAVGGLAVVAVEFEEFGH